MATKGRAKTGGRKKGTPNKDKPWRDAVRKAVDEMIEADEGGKAVRIKALDLLARKLIGRALEGDVKALKEIGDRLDGRPAQAVELAAQDGGSVEFVMILNGEK